MVMHHVHAPRVAVYAGSFDPVTIGHLDIIRRAAGLFDRLIVAVGENVRKKPWLDTDTRLGILRTDIQPLRNRGAVIDVMAYRGLLVTFAQQNGACALVRGLRAVADFDSEFQMAMVNTKLNHGIETVFLLAGETAQFISSSAVREIAHHGGDLRPFVTESTARVLEAHRARMHPSTPPA